ncbi:MAG TPA: hypothetical protein VN222_10130 [Novosphingobium sp.]|nr:hypothetical protein [Novosphingobium sp.]
MMKHPNDVTAVLALLAAGPLALLPQAASAQSRSVAAGSSWTIARETVLDRLDIAPGGQIRPAAGRELSMTVDGVGTPLAPGSYKGRIVLAPTAPIAWKAMLGNRDYRVRAALYVDGAPDPLRSVAATWRGGQVAAGQASNLHIASADPGFTGIAIEGASRYVLNDPVIELTGNGVDDSIGYGAGIVVQGSAQVTINRPRIFTQGVVRTAIFVAGNAQVDIDGAQIETRNGTLPADYKFSILPGEMMEVPYGLGISGNVRATNVQGTAHVTYRNSHIRAQAWGALATDGEGPTWLTAINSTIETLESGYGAYANGHAQDLFDNCVFRVPDYGLVVGGPGSATFTNGTMVSSGRFGVMMHQGAGGGTLRIEKGSTFVTGQTAIVVKGRGTTIVVDGGRLVPGNGVLLQTMENDDPIMREMMRNPPPPPPAGAAPAGPVESGEVVASFSNTRLEGDIFHAMTGKGGMRITLGATASLRGGISLAVARPASGAEPTRATFASVGEVVNAPGFGAKPEPLQVRVEDGASWEVTRPSFVSELTLAPHGRIGAPVGQRLELRVNGQAVPLAPGHYQGQVELLPVGDR